jgi:hypothetical protein
LENTSGTNPSGSTYFAACCNSGLLNTGSFKFAYTSSTIISEGFWDTIGYGISNGLTPYLQIVQVNNSNVIGLYEITNVVYSNPGNGGQYAVTANGIPAVYASGAWNTGETYAVSFTLNGSGSGTGGTTVDGPWTIGTLQNTGCMSPASHGNKGTRYI